MFTWPCYITHVSIKIGLLQSLLKTNKGKTKEKSPESAGIQGILIHKGKMNEIIGNVVHYGLSKMTID